MWSNKKGDVSIRILRSRNDSLPITSPAIYIDFRLFDIPFTSMNSAQRTEDGDMIVDLQGSGNSDPPSFRRYDQKLLKITIQGTVLWEMNFESSISMPAVGKDAVFFLDRSLDPMTSEPGLALVNVSLEDGSITYRNPLPDLYRRVRVHPSDKHLRLFCDEAYAVWRDEVNLAYVFSTKSGRLLEVYTRSTLMDPIVSRHKCVIWDINHDVPNPPFGGVAGYSQHVTCQEGTPALKFESIVFPDQIKQMYPHSEWRFSGDHLASFYFTHHILTTVNFNRFFLGQKKITDPDTKIWVLVMDKVPSEKFDGSEMQKKASAVPISLPSRSKKFEDRRPLELDLPWSMMKKEYLGMENDYLVYHSREEEILYLIDFWPNW